MSETVILVCTLVMTAGTMITILPLLGFDIRLRGRSNVGVESAKLPLVNKRLRTALILAVLSTLLSGFCVYQRIWGRESGIPLSGTEEATRWTYTPLREVHGRYFHDERVILDGVLFVNCTFGPRLTFVYNGTAPFEILNGQQTADFAATLSIETENMAFKKFLQAGTVLDIFKYPQRFKLGDIVPKSQ